MGIEITCGCGNQLQFGVVDIDNDGDITIKELEQCSDCVDAAKEDGKKAGYDDGYDEGHAAGVEEGEKKSE